MHKYVLEPVENGCQLSGHSQHRALFFILYRVFEKKRPNLDHKYQKNDKSTVIIICFFMSPNDTTQASGVLYAYILKGFECRQAQGLFSSPLHPHHLSSSSTGVKMRRNFISTRLHGMVLQHRNNCSLYLRVEYRIIQNSCFRNLILEIK